MLIDWRRSRHANLDSPWIKFIQENGTRVPESYRNLERMNVELAAFVRDRGG